MRNPFKFAFKSGTDQFYINDVGQNIWEEIDNGVIGADYGWNIREGHCANGSTTNCGAPPAGLTNPIYDYGHGAGLCAITGAGFSTGDWGPVHGNAYYFADSCGALIFQLVPVGGGFTRQTFHTAPGGAGIIAMLYSPAGKALYYTQASGAVRRIRFLPRQFYTPLLWR